MPVSVCEMKLYYVQLFIVHCMYMACFNSKRKKEGERRNRNEIGWKEGRKGGRTEYRKKE